MELLRISAKNLGQLALDGCCQRCFWLKARLGWKLPYQTFPGIFSSLDSYSKHVIRTHFDSTGKVPKWLGIQGTPLPVPHHSVFQLIERRSGIQLTGAPDEMIQRRDRSLAIIDYKTARHTNGQDALMPLYEVQLNGYGLIAESLGLGRVTDLRLIYCEPMTSILDDQEMMSLIDAKGFRLKFQATVIRVPLQLMSLMVLMKKARRIYDQPKPPPPREGCKDCVKATAMVGLLNGKEAIPL